ncbi:MAG: arginase family protein [Pseudomonadota bacterium]
MSRDPADWLVTPWFFDLAEPLLAEAAPAGAAQSQAVPTDRAAEGMGALHRPIAAHVAARAAAGRCPVSFAGDCTASIAVLAGLQRAGIDPAIVWVDAHGDFNTPETSPSQFLGGMPLAMMTGRGPDWLMRLSGARPVADSRVTLVDARDLDPEEAVAVAASAIAHVDLAALDRVALERPVLLHVDLDVIDCHEAPGFAFPVPGGPTAEAVAAALERLAARVRIAAVSISAWSPSLDREGTTAAACRRALAPVAPLAG